MLKDVSQLYAIPAFRLYAIVTLLLVLKIIEIVGSSSRIAGNGSSASGGRATGSARTA